MPKATKIKSKLSAPVFDTYGKVQAQITLPYEIFGQKPNLKLLSQAYRVYFTNQSTHKAHTKTRGEVRGGGAKPWRQKGTGKARAGSIRSPLWVGGGVVFGPKYRDVKLKLPQKIKRQALIHALSQKGKMNAVRIIANVEKIEPKTKILANLLAKLGLKNKTLLVVSGKNQNVNLASRNICDLSVDIVRNLNAFKVLENTNLIFSREAIREL